MLMVAPARAQDAQTIEIAKQAAAAWLQVVDAAQYDVSWDRAAALFKAAVPKEAWLGAIQSVRPQLGALKARKLKAISFTRSIAGAPDGEYVVIQYDSEFEKRAGTIETVTDMREKDGSWKVSGYHIN